MRPALSRVEGIPSLGRRGTILIGIVFTMMVFVVMAVTGASMFADQAYTSVHVMRMAEANSVRTGVADYVLKWLQDDANANWSDVGTAPMEMTLGGHNSVVTFTNAARNSITVNMATETEESAATAAKSESFGVYRVPRAFYYPLFRGSNVDELGNAEILTLDDVQVARGVVYSNGQMNFTNGSTIQSGELFYSAGSDPITPPGGLSQVSITNPQPSMPNYDMLPARNSYEARIADYNALIAGAETQGVGDFTVTTGSVTVADIDAAEDPPDSDEIAEVRNLILSGTGTIAGPGTIVAWQNVLFQNNFPGSCKQNSDDFKSSDGGCKRLAGPHASLVWSAAQADADQAGAAAACAALNLANEGGYSSGWSMPTELQLTQNAGAALADAHLNLPAGVFYWSSAPGRTVNLLSGVAQDDIPTEVRGVVCVRSASANNLGTATVNPGGELVLIAKGHILRSDDAQGLSITAAPDPADSRVTMYARNELPTDHVHISGSSYAGVPVNIDEALIMAGRRLMITNGARLQTGWSVLYVRHHPDSNVNNYLEVAGPPGAVPASANATRVSGTLISVSERNPNLILRSGADIQGIVYSNRIDDGTDDGGRLAISNTRVNGSVIANRFEGGVISDVQIIGASVNYPLARQVPDGFSSCVYKQPNSWQGD